MKIIQVLFFTCCLFFEVAFSDETPNNTICQDAGIPGEWSSMINNQLTNLPDQYFMCGFTIRQHSFTVSLKNCLCKYRWYRWRYTYGCKFCPNTFHEKTAGIKLVFCRDTNWTDQNIKIFETSSVQKHHWRDIIMCPENTYANGFQIGSGHMHDKNIGFRGLKIRCSTKDGKNFNFPEDRMSIVKYSMHYNNNGDFIAGVKIKYEPEGMLVAFCAQFRPMIVIAKAIFKYKNDSLIENYPIILDSTVVSNNFGTSAMKNISFSKTYETSGRWVINNPYIKKYLISPQIIITPPSSNDNQQSPYQSKIATQNFGFDRQIKTIVSLKHDLFITISPFTEVSISSFVNENRGSRPFEGVIYFNNLNKQNQTIMLYDISGIWEGVTNSGVFYNLTENKIQKKETRKQLKQEEEGNQGNS